ncbi:MAG: prepilin-type N-terminal cleavage/methylation domain-containing protein [Azonexus sp.]
MKNSQSGFTLVEIAIVLVIIGLLLGGVLKGQELINSAKVKNLANDFRTIPTMVFAYQDKFRALPGDDRAASAHVAGVPLATNGNGDGRIDGAWNAPTPCATESCNFWQHVRLANLASGSTDPTSADYIPRNSEGGPIGITGADPSGNNWAGNFFVCSMGIQGRFVRQLDITSDDGNTSTGSIRVIAAADGAPFPNLTPADDARLFTVCSSN